MESQENIRTKARLFVQAPLGAEGIVPLSPDQAHYLGRVMRLGEGAPLAIFNGSDGEWLAEIAEIGRKSGLLRAIRQTRPQATEPDLWLLFAPVKHVRVDFIAQKATELGASALWPVITRHTIASRVNVDRLQSNAIEAAEQCERLTVPQVFEPAKLADALADWPADRQLWLLDETGKGPPMLDGLRAAGPGTAHAILIGPEGGFHADELDAIGKLPFATSVGLGPRILRADTAALAALAVWQAAIGDGSDKPPPRN